MVRVSYSHRIILDHHFVRWLSKIANKKDVISKLLRININSREHPKENVLISEKDFEDLCNEGIIKDKDTIRGCMSPYHNIDEKLGENLKDLPKELERLILGVILTKEEPFQVILITTKDGKKSYSEYAEFLNEIRSFDIKNEEEGLVIIGDFYKKFCLEREINR